MTLSQLISKLEDAKKVHGDVKVEVHFGDYYGEPSRVASYHLENEKYTIVEVEPALLTQEEIDVLFEQRENRPDEFHEFISRSSVEEDFVPAEIVSIEKAYELSIDKQYEEYLRNDAVDSNGYIRTDTPWL